MGVVEPPRYPAIPHLRAHASLDGDDVVLDADALKTWLQQDVVVEEKLDGANVCLWRPDDARVEVLGRSRSGARDRGGQLGRLRAWSAERSQRLVSALTVGQAVYGEWLWREHSVRYDALPDYFIGLDVWSSGTGFLSIDERDAVLEEAGICRPPRVFVGRLRNVQVLNDLLEARSRFSEAHLEGLVLRRTGPGRDAVKLLSPRFRRLDDAAWSGGRPLNKLASVRGADVRGANPD